jgi:hypothetical protein
MVMNLSALVVLRPQLFLGAADACRRTSLLRHAMTAWFSEG